MRYRHRTDLGTITLASTVASVAGFALGALAMYLFDPESGRRRRAVARDKAAGLAHDTVDAVQSKARNVRNRATGLAHEAGDAVSAVIHWTEKERRSRPRETATPMAGTLDS